MSAALACTLTCSTSVLTFCSKVVKRVPRVFVPDISLHAEKGCRGGTRKICLNLTCDLIGDGVESTLILALKPSEPKALLATRSANSSALSADQPDQRRLQ